jgi:hypothetical protein
MSGKILNYSLGISSSIWLKLYFSMFPMFLCGSKIESAKVELGTKIK